MVVLAFVLLFVGFCFGRLESEADKPKVLKDVVLSGNTASGLRAIRFYLWARNKPWVDSDTFKGAEVFTAYNVTGSKVFNISRKTKFLIHGYSNSGFTFCKPFVENYIKQDDFNLLCMDWHQLAAVVLFPIWDAYFTAASNVVPAADHATLFLNAWIHTYKLDPANIHIIGHSLGGQVAGQLARSVYGTLGKKIGRISGLDPAGPSFVDDDLEDFCLKKGDASFVDVIHSDGAWNRPFVVRGYFGNLRPMGDLDFYPNGGGPNGQPGCWNLVWIAEGACEHGRSSEYFVESINNPTAFPARLCHTTSDATSSSAPSSEAQGNPAGNCDTGDGITGDYVIHMGEYAMQQAPKDATDIAPPNTLKYYLTTNAAYPYSIPEKSHLTSRLNKFAD